MIGTGSLTFEPASNRVVDMWDGMRTMAIAVTLVTVLAGCGDSGVDEAATSSTTTTPPGSVDGTSTTTSEVPKYPDRPEGDWYNVRWDTVGQDGTKDRQGVAGLVHYTFTPTCEIGQGPCDIEMTGAGPDGGAFPVGHPHSDSNRPFTVMMEWDETSGTYVTTAEEKTECFPDDGSTITDGYTITTIARYTFTAETDDSPAHMTSDREITYEPATEEAAAAGCTPLTTRQKSAAAPMSAFKDSAPSLVGTYVMSVTIEEWTPPEEGYERGVAALFDDRVEITDDQGAYRIKGTTDDAVALTEADGVFSATSVDAFANCNVTGPEDYDAKEMWSDLSVVAVTDTGQPILSGIRHYLAEPNPVARAMGCERLSEKGWVILLPVEILS